MQRLVASGHLKRYLSPLWQACACGGGANVCMCGSSGGGILFVGSGVESQSGWDDPPTAHEVEGDHRHAGLVGVSPGKAARFVWH